MAESGSFIPETIDLLVQEINETFNKLIDQLNERRNNLVSELQEKRRRKQLCDIEHAQMVEEIIKTKRDIETGLKQNPLKLIQQEMLAKLEEKLTEVSLNDKKTHMHLKVDTIKLEQLIATIGEIIENPSIDYTEFKSVIAVGEKGKAPGQLGEPRCIAINPTNGNIYVTEVENKRVSVFSEKGDYLTHFGEDLFNQPHGIGIQGDDIYVSDIIHHAIFHFKLPDFKLIKQVGKKGSGKDMFIGPSQVYIFNEFLYVPDWGNSRIAILSPQFKFYQPLKHITMTFPCHVNIKQDLVYVLSSKDNPCMHVFTMEGSKIRSFLSRGEGQQVMWAGFFCIDTDINMIISDFAGHSIKVFSSQGQLLHTLGKKGREIGMFESPHGIALTENNKLLCVSSNNIYCLQIFSA